VRSKTPQQADKILAAAAQLFATQRFHEARMEDIAALAEVGKGTLYRYFKDKEELYLALLERAAEGMAACLEGVERAVGPRAQLLRLVAAILGYFDSQPHLLELIQHAEVMQRAGREFPWQKARNLNMARVKEIFRAGQRDGVFAIDDPDVAALMLLGGLRAVFRFGPRPRPADLAERIVGGFLGGYGDRGRAHPRPVTPALAVGEVRAVPARIE
jgi:AcrR family transcriptional regulator